MAEPPSERPPELDGDGSDVAVVGAAFDCVGVVAARLSIDVPIAPFPGDDDVPPDDDGVGADCAVGEESPETWEPPLLDGLPDELGALEELFPSPGLDDGPLGDGSSKSERDGPEEDPVGLGYEESDEDESRPESEPGPASGPAPTSGPPMSLPPVSADIPRPMFEPTSLVERVEGESDEESDDREDPESELEPDPESDDELDDELEFESDDELEFDEELELFEPESPSLLPVSPPSPPAPSPPRPLLDGPLYPSIRLSTAWWNLSPAFRPRLSRTPSARVCGVCFRASRPAWPPALMVALTS
ncbi:hypothetical protein [Streptomyces chartreusis]|uniref:hypothetical protein n=1 Tax=Streptomyces chartreusis TaxID=1969 RepID=UPI00364C393E